MKISDYVDSMKRSLETAAAPGGDEVKKTADLLSAAIESAVTLSLLEALADATGEITSMLSDAAVEARLRGRDVEFVVSEVAHPPVALPPGEEADSDANESIARISLRLPESLKELVERAASGDGISVNAWLVRAIEAAVDSGFSHSRRRRGPGSRRRFTGYARA